MGITEAQAASLEQLRDEALCRSVMYGALSLGLHCPTQENRAWLRSEDARLALWDAASLLMACAGSKENSPATSSSGTSGNLVARVENWVATFDALEPEELLARYGRIFGHTARSSVCPYETEYGQEGLFEQPRQLATIMGYYQAFGLTTRVEERERADHAGCELEFMDFLCRKEAYALESGDQATCAETRKAQRLFLKDHLGRFGRAFARLLQEQEPEGFFRRLGDLLLDFLTCECQRFRIEPGALVIPLRSAEDDKVPMACGGQQDLIQLGVPR